jgi:hypothetical protein
MVLLQLGIFAVIATGLLASNKPSLVSSGIQAVHDAVQPQPQGYLLVLPDEVDYFQWTEDTNHNLTGTFHSAYIKSHNTMQTTLDPLSGTLDGTKSTLHVQGCSISFIGTVNGDTLTITSDSAGCQYNDDFHKATIQQYNTEVNTLRERTARGQDPIAADATCSG